MTITGNLLTLNGGTSSNNLALDNVSLAVITGNFFGCGGACTTFTEILLGSHTTAVNVQSNALRFFLHDPREQSRDKQYDRRRLELIGGRIVRSRHPIPKCPQRADMCMRRRPAISSVLRSAAAMLSSKM
jgi:hypothetical protein